MLTDAQIDQYHGDGYVIPEFRLPESELADIRADHARLVERHPEFRNYCSALLGYDLSFLNYARNRTILDMVQQLIGPDIALWNSSFFAKPAHGGHATPWHQDGEYWPIRPLATCTAWIAVDASTRENGCLRVIRGSHKERRLRAHATNDSPDLTLNQELLKSEYDEGQADDIVLEPGQISLHDVYLVHGSEANHSPNPRRGMTLRFMPTTSVFDRAMAADIYQRIGNVSHADREVFLMRGEDRSGQNSFAMQR